MHPDWLSVGTVTAVIRCFFLQLGKKETTKVIALQDSKCRDCPWAGEGNPFLVVIESVSGYEEGS